MTYRTNEPPPPPDPRAVARARADVERTLTRLVALRQREAAGVRTPGISAAHLEYREAVRRLAALGATYPASPQPGGAAVVEAAQARLDAARAAARGATDALRRARQGLAVAAAQGIPAHVAFAENAVREAEAALRIALPAYRQANAAWLAARARAGLGEAEVQGETRKPRDAASFSVGPYIDRILQNALRLPPAQRAGYVTKSMARLKRATGTHGFDFDASWDVRTDGSTVVYGRQANNARVVDPQGTIWRADGTDPTQVPPFRDPPNYAHPGVTRVPLRPKR